jgi:hypothetical protein
VSIGYKPVEQPSKPAEASNNLSVSKLNPEAVEYVPTSPDLDEQPLESERTDKGFTNYRGTGRKFRGAPRPTFTWPNRSRVWSQSQSQTSNQLLPSGSSQISPTDNKEALVSTTDGVSETKVIDVANQEVVKPPVVSEAKITKENVVMQQKYEDLRKLRNQVDDIWKRKESLIQVIVG